MEGGLHIAWLGPAPGAEAGVPGVAGELIGGLGAIGHRVDCFFPSAGQPIPERLQDAPGVTFNWGTARFSWDRWYSRTRFGAFISGMVLRGLASRRLRRAILERHAADAFDCVYQFSTIESPAVPPSLAREIPLVLHPETHAAGELRRLIAERRLALRCGGPLRLGAYGAILALRSLAQRRAIRRARLLVCISAVFRDHMVRDYGYPRADTSVVPNPVRIERFEPSTRPPSSPPAILVLGRVALRKGVQDVVAVARILHERGFANQMRVVGGPSLFSDYTPLLEELPPGAEYVGSIEPEQVPGEVARADVLLQASTYEPFALTVAEALAAGVPVVGTSEVGAIESVSREASAEVAPGDPAAMAEAIIELLARLAAEPAKVRAAARMEAERRFAPEVVCEQIGTALERVCRPAATAPPSGVAGGASGGAAG